MGNTARYRLPNFRNVKLQLFDFNELEEVTSLGVASSKDGKSQTKKSNGGATTNQTYDMRKGS